MKRIQKQRKIKDTILILTNGKQTEMNYFKAITSQYKSIFTIKVEFENGQCDNLVQKAIERQLLNDYNQIWCVFDVDDSFEEKHLLVALQEAKRHGINVALSNEAFEIWLMFHLTNTISPTLTRDKYAKELTKHLKEIDEKLSYSKTNKNLIETIFLPKLFIGLNNSKKTCEKLEAKHQAEYQGQTNYPLYQWKSFTTVFRLIEALKLEKKNDN